jgi:hypothetical protein
MRLCKRKKRKKNSFSPLPFFLYSFPSFSYSSFYSYLHQPPTPNSLLPFLHSSSFDSSIILKDTEREEKRREKNRERKRKKERER